MIIHTPVQKANLPPTENRKRLIMAIALLILIFGLSTAVANLLIPKLGETIDTASFAQKNFVLKSFMLLLTLLAMFILYKRKQLSYGFTKGENLNYPRFTKHAILLGIAGLLAVIIFNIINFAITKKPPTGFPEEHILNRILFIWLWSSIVEEILFRGLFQSLVETLSYPVFRFRKATISMAVLLSAVAFASLHLLLLTQGMSALFVIGIFINTLLLGFLAGYLREKTGSIYPAIYVHIVFNIVGSIPILIQLML